MRMALAFPELRGFQAMALVLMLVMVGGIFLASGWVA